MDEKFITNLKEEVIEALNLEEIKSEDIDNDTPLFGPQLGLDSIDALELIVLLERNYGIKLKTQEESKTVLESIDSMAAYIQQHRTK